MRSSLSMGGRIAVAAKESTSPALGLQLMISFKLFKAALWRMYLPLVAVQPGLLHVAGTASSDNISQKSLDSFKAAVQTTSNGMAPHAVRDCDIAKPGARLQAASAEPVLPRVADEGLPPGRRSQIGPTTHSADQAQPAPGISSINPLAVPKALEAQQTGFTEMVGACRSSCCILADGLHLQMMIVSGAAFLGSSGLGCTAEQAFASTTAGAALASSLQRVQDQSDYDVLSSTRDDTSKSGMSADEEREPAAHPGLRRRGARAVSPPSGYEHLMHACALTL
ncbi:TPA: hypothetical protein ACH3X2_003573 [Trebouxia sp. C0005]